MTITFGSSNIFEGLPEYGTILGQATFDEKEAILENHRRLNAINNAGGNISRIAEHQALEEERYELWNTILKRINVPYAWPVAIDWSTGYIYAEKN